jgi:hypothetical protein
MSSRDTRSNDADRQTEMAGMVDRNIAALLQRRRAEEVTKAMQERLADAITSFTGSLPFVYRSCKSSPKPCSLKGCRTGWTRWKAERGRTSSSEPKTTFKISA